MEKTTQQEKARAGMIAGIVAGTALIAAVPAVQPALASETAGATPATPAVEQADTQIATTQGVRSIPNIQGTFAWNQGVTASNTQLAKYLYGAAAVLCGSQANEIANAASADEVAPIDQIAVTGDVANAFVAEVAEYEQKAPVRATLGCTCSGNPADGRASANAAVAGFTLASLVEEAAPVEGANTITFVCADGYETALPLAYVMQRYSIIVTEVNEEDCAEAVGCANQLWLGATGARSFARDVVEIRITAEAEPPAAPGAATDANLPNVGVTAGTAA